MTYLFWICILLLVYVYNGYGWLLRLIPAKKTKTLEANEPPSITLLITVYNEEAVIEAKLVNALALDYPADKLQILVASDGSTDRTEELVSNHPDPRVVLFRPENPIGKTDTQNKAIATATGEILVFTDAETMFDPHFLTELVKPFADPRVGGATGHLLFERDSASGISQNQGFYWNYELQLRQRESDLGLLAVASGACMAIRTRLFKPMTAAYGEDCIVPLSIVDQGFLYKHAAGAVATDRMASTQQGEFRTRVRMTLRNWQGTWSYPGLLNPFRHPGYAFALWSHKLLRWCSPLFIFCATISVFYLASSALIYALAALGFMGFYLMAALGFWAERGGFKLPLVHTAYSFLLANAGFTVGVWRAITGHQVTRYSNQG